MLWKKFQLEYFSVKCSKRCVSVCICMCTYVCMCRTHLYPFSASTLQVTSSLKSMMCSFFSSFHGHSIAENSDEDHSRNGDRNGEAGQAAGLTKVQKETILGREGGSKSKYCQHKRKTNWSMLIQVMKMLFLKT